LAEPVRSGLILFAHGSRDPRWREPFERLVAKVEGLQPKVDVRLAYLELMAPDLASVISELVSHGCGEIRVVPVFLGQGGHVREDLPVLLRGLQKQYPTVILSQARAVGDDDDVLDAIAAYCVRGEHL
jgi:sirohydrochlorin cobaltochelatase